MKLAVSYINSIHWLVPTWDRLCNSPISVSYVARWKYANETRHDLWFPLNFLFCHGLTEIRGREQEVFCHMPKAPLPPSAGPHFIWIINDSLFFSATQRRFGPSCFCSSRKKRPPAMTKDCFSLTVEPCPGSTGRTSLQPLHWWKAEMYSSQPHTEGFGLFLYFE